MTLAIGSFFSLGNYKYLIITLIYKTSKKITDLRKIQIILLL